MENAKVIILGASPNPWRFSYRAARALASAKYNIVPIGLKNTEVAGQKILDIREKPPVDNVDTITVYMHPKNQTDYYAYILSLAPKRIIFNPGAENPELSSMASQQHIEVINACTLVMLNSGAF